MLGFSENSTGKRNHVTAERMTAERPICVCLKPLLPKILPKPVHTPIYILQHGAYEPYADLPMPTTPHSRTAKSMIAPQTSNKKNLRLSARTMAF